MIKDFYYWLYSCESVRVQNHVHIGHYFFGRKLLLVGKYYYSI